MAYSLLANSVLSQIINSWPNRKLLSYGYLEQLKDILPSIVLAALMGFCVSLINQLQISNGMTLLIQITVGAAFYIVFSAVLHLESYEYLLDMVRQILKKFMKKQNAV